MRFLLINGLQEPHSSELQVHYFATFRQKYYLVDYQEFLNLKRVNKPLFIFFRNNFRFQLTPYIYEDKQLNV